MFNAQALQLRFFITQQIHKHVPAEQHYFTFNKMGVYPLTLLISLSCMTTLMISWTDRTNLDGFPCFHPGSGQWIQLVVYGAGTMTAVPWRWRLHRHRPVSPVLSARGILANPPSNNSYIFVFFLCFSQELIPNYNYQTYLYAKPWYRPYILPYGILDWRILHNT